MRLLWTGAVLLLIFLSAFALRSHQVPFFIDLPLCVCWWLVGIDLPHGFAGDLLLLIFLMGLLVTCCYWSSSMCLLSTGDMLLLIFLYVFALNRCHVAINLPLCVCLWHVDIVLPISICPLQVPCCYWAPSVRLLLTGTVPTMLVVDVSLYDFSTVAMFFLSSCTSLLSAGTLLVPVQCCYWSSWCHVIIDLPLCVCSQ